MYNRCNSSLGNSTLRTGKGVQYVESKNNTTNKGNTYCGTSLESYFNDKTDIDGNLLIDSSGTPSDDFFNQ